MISQDSCRKLAQAFTDKTGRPQAVLQSHDGHYKQVDQNACFNKTGSSFRFPGHKVIGFSIKGGDAAK